MIAPLIDTVDSRVDISAVAPPGGAGPSVRWRAFDPADAVRPEDKVERPPTFWRRLYDFLYEFNRY